MTVFAATGHRPNKLGGYSASVRLRLVTLARSYLREHRPDRVISGMALGWDQAWTAAAIIEVIPFIAAVPFEGQEQQWPLAARTRYHELLKCAERVVIVTPNEGYSVAAMHRRNEWMVDHADRVVALWDGQAAGGTYNCLEYAHKQGKLIDNLWDRWLKASRT